MKKNILPMIMGIIIGNTACTTTSTTPIDGISSHISQIYTLNLKGGVMVYEDSNSPGPIIICIPGIGDTRGQFRLLGPQLVLAGYRVISVDPRGQGDSDASFEQYSATSIGDDIIKLVDKLDANVYIVGNSAGGASAAWVAAKLPNKVKGVVFLNAFIRDHPIPFFDRLILNVALTDLWGPSAMIGHYKGLFISNPPTDQKEYTASMKQSLSKEGHVSALKNMTFASKADVEAQLKNIKAPVLAIAGNKDPDFKDPEDELNWILSKIKGKKALIEGAGHYPHLEYPEQVAKLIVDFASAQK